MTELTQTRERRKNKGIESLKSSGIWLRPEAALGKIIELPSSGAGDNKFLGLFHGSLEYFLRSNSNRG